MLIFFNTFFSSCSIFCTIFSSEFISSDDFRQNFYFLGCVCVFVYFGFLWVLSLVSANYWKNRPFSLPGRYLFIVKSFSITKKLSRLLWSWNQRKRRTSFLSMAIFYYFSCGLFSVKVFYVNFFFFFFLIEYIRQLINLYNRIETINLLGLLRSATLNRYEYASIISCFFYQFSLIEKSVERILF